MTTETEHQQLQQDIDDHITKERKRLITSLTKDLRGHFPTLSEEEATKMAGDTLDKTVKEYLKEMG